MNFFQDVKLVQGLLNHVPLTNGGPQVKLDEDGIVGPKTIDAIRKFQVASQSVVDGRVDPGGDTFGKLLGPNAPGGGDVQTPSHLPVATMIVPDEDIDKIYVPQFNFDCWICAGAMMLRFKNRSLGRPGARLLARQRMVAAIDPASDIPIDDPTAGRPSGLKKGQWVNTNRALGLINGAGPLISLLAQSIMNANNSPLLTHVKKFGDPTYLHAVVVIGADATRVCWLDPEISNGGKANEPFVRTTPAATWAGWCNTDVGSWAFFPNGAVGPTALNTIFGTWGTIG
jgi:peptidoglycan hydrolase-like protein with peptidoglycan-binding domain